MARRGIPLKEVVDRIMEERLYGDLMFEEAKTRIALQQLISESVGQQKLANMDWQIAKNNAALKIERERTKSLLEENK